MTPSQVDSQYCQEYLKITCRQEVIFYNSEYEKYTSLFELKVPS